MKVESYIFSDCAFYYSCWIGPNILISECMNKKVTVLFNFKFKEKSMVDKGGES